MQFSKIAIFLSFFILTVGLACKDKPAEDSHAGHDHAGHNHDHDHDHDHEKPKQIILRKADVMPLFPGCEKYIGKETEERIQMCSQNQMYDYFIKNIKYPKSAIDSKLEGTAGVEFTVDETGIIKDIVIVKSINSDCDAAIISCLESMNSMKSKWQPAKHQGKVVPIRMTIPIRMQLPK